MKVLVDTSAWVDFLNGYSSPEAAALAELVAGRDEVCTCGIIVAEVFQGLRRDQGRGQLANLFRQLEFLEPSGVDLYLRAADVYSTLRRQGLTVRSTIDCVIAVLAEETGCYVLAKDRDMETILGSDLLKTSLWRPTGR